MKHKIILFVGIISLDWAMAESTVTISASQQPRQQNGQQFYCPNDEPTLTASATPIKPETNCCNEPTLLETTYEWEGMLHSHTNEESQQLSSSWISATTNADILCQIKWKWSCKNGTTEETVASGTWEKKVVANQPACSPQLSAANPVSIAGSGNFTNDFIGNNGVDPGTGHVWAKFFSGSVTNLRGDETLSEDGPVQTGTSCGGDFQPASHGQSGSVSFSVRVWGILSVGGSKTFSALNPAQINGEEFKRHYYQAFRQTLTPTTAFLNGNTYEKLLNQYGIPYGSAQNNTPLNGDETISGQAKAAGYAGKSCKSDCCPTGT